MSELEKDISQERAAHSRPMIDICASSLENIPFSKISGNKL